MLSLALVVAFAGMARASYDSIIDWMQTALNPDLFVMPSQNVDVRTIAVSGDDGRRSSPRFAGVARVQMVRNARIIVSQDAGDGRRDRREQPRGDGARARRSPATPSEMYRRAAAGEG